MEEAEFEKCLKKLGKWKGRHPRQGKQQEQRTKIGLRRVPNTYTNHWYCFLHLIDEETEARRSRVLFSHGHTGVEIRKAGLWTPSIWPTAPDLSRDLTVFHGTDLSGMGRSSGIGLESADTRDNCISSLLDIQWHHIASLKSTMVRVFTLQKLVDPSNQGFICSFGCKPSGFFFAPWRAGC